MRLGRVLAAVAAAVLLSAACAGPAPVWTRSAAARYGPPIALPAPSTTGGMPLQQALQQRRSVRVFAGAPLPMASIGQLFWAGQGVTSPDGKRSAPSAGGLYPLDLYIVTRSALLHYLPVGHRVESRAMPDPHPQLRAAAFGQQPVAAAPDVLVVAAAVDRTRHKYGARADTYVALEAGHATENILLEATALGLAAVPIGSIDPEQVVRALGLPPDETVLYLVPIGYPGR